MSDKYGEAIKIIKEDINVAKQGVSEGYVKIKMGLSGEMVDHKKAIPQLKVVLEIVEEENRAKKDDYLMSENTQNLIRGMQVEINKLKAEVKRLREKGEGE